MCIGKQLDASFLVDEAMPVAGSVTSVANANAAAFSTADKSIASAISTAFAKVLIHYGNAV